MLEFKRKVEENFVDAIEEGKIVRVSEDYARREGLLVLRKSVQISTQQSPAQKKDEEARKNKGFIGMDDLRRPLSPKNDELLKELVENFHWTIVQKRKAKGLTRKKVAEELGETELNIKMIENGVLPVSNFVLINKLESYYNVQLRKNKVQSGSDKPLRQIIEFDKNPGFLDPYTKIDKSNKNQSSLTQHDKNVDGPEIEIIEDSNGGKDSKISDSPKSN